MPISAHVSLNRFCIVYAKLLEYTTCVLCLTNESPLFGLLDLKSKKECENSDHGHFKSIAHDFAIIKLFSIRKIPKTFKSCSWCLFKPIERLTEFINMVRMFFTFEAG
jgi:hypothetical protein